MHKKNSIKDQSRGEQLLTSELILAGDDANSAELAKTTKSSTVFRSGLLASLHLARFASVRPPARPYMEEGRERERLEVLAWGKKKDGKMVLHSES